MFHYRKVRFINQFFTTVDPVKNPITANLADFIEALLRKLTIVQVENYVNFLLFSSDQQLLLLQSILNV